MNRRAALRAGALMGIVLVGAPVLATLEGCVASREPRPIAYGKDECAYCRMIVSEPRYAAAMLTGKGRTLVFDSVECLASHCVKDAMEATHARALRVSVEATPGTMFPAEQATFARLMGSSSPMGKGLLAMRSPAEAGALPPDTERLRWTEVLALMKHDGLQRGAGLQSSSSL